MNTREFGEWVTQHVRATGGDAARLPELLWANREVIVDRLGATFGELCECTQRLFESGRVPQFPSEHPNALVKELKALRAEAAREESTRRNVIPAGHAMRGCDCPACNGGEILPSYDQAAKRLTAYVRKHQGITGGIGTGGEA